MDEEPDGSINGEEVGKFKAFSQWLKRRDPCAVFFVYLVFLTFLRDKTLAW